MLVYSLIGDSNIKRNMTTMNIASRASMQNCQVLDCPDLVNLEGSFASVRDESNVCIFSAVSELLVNCEDRGTVQASMDYTMSSLKTKLTILCQARSKLQVCQFFLISDLIYRVFSH